MSGGKITLNDGGVALLGNAMLLGCLADRYGLPGSSPQREQRALARSASANLKELHDALFAAAMLDKGLAKVLDTSEDRLGERAENTRFRLQQLMGEKCNLSTVRFKDFQFPAAVSERYNIAQALQTVGEMELDSPIVQLCTTTLFERVRCLVVDYAKDCAALDLELSRAEADFIGLEGLVLRREMTQPPKWHQWNSTSARQIRKATGWLQEMREKARRHVLQPLERAHGDSSTKYDLAQLGHELEKLGPSFQSCDLPVHSGLGALATFLCASPSVSPEMLEQLFPSYGAMPEHRDYRVDADPFNFLTFTSAQVAWFAVKQGWVLCIAEDGLNESSFSWVSSEEFPRISETDDFPLPEEISISGCFDLDERARSTLGAERLWFVLVEDAAAALGKANQGEKQAHDGIKQAREFNKGFTVSDAPFVEEGLKMLEMGHAKSALNAAQLLVDKHGEVTEANWVPGSTAIRTYSLGSAEGRLQKAISKARKNLKK